MAVPPDTVVAAIAIVLVWIPLVAWIIRWVVINPLICAYRNIIVFTKSLTYTPSIIWAVIVIVLISITGVHVYAPLHWYAVTVRIAGLILFVMVGWGGSYYGLFLGGRKESEGTFAGHGLLLLACLFIVMLYNLADPNH